MTFRFVHTADWQLGRAFARFPEALASRLAEARLDAIDRIAAEARATGARHVLVAGDVWDQETPSERTLVQPLDRLARAADLTWWLLPGNHDPARPQGLWARLAGIGPPANVRLCTGAAPLALTADAWLLPAPLTTKRPVTDPTAELDAVATPAGALRIGLAHGSIASFAEDDGGAAAIAVDRAERAGLAYLALGDWHGTQRIDARTWYAGTPEPDRFPRNEPGACLAVAIAGPGRAPAVEVRSTARFRWRREEVAWLPGMGLEALEGLAGDADVPLDRTLVRLVLAGSIGLAERARLHGHIGRLRERLAHLDVDDDGLATLVETHDLDALGPDAGLRAAAAELAARAPGEPAARRALDLLFAWALER